MQNLIARILTFADLHWLTVPVGRQKGQIIKGFSGLVEKVINIWKRSNMRNRQKVMDKFYAEGPYDYLISAGDFIEAEYNEKGIITPADVRKVEEYKGDIQGAVSLSGKDYWLSGDHELGYILPLSCDPEGGMNAASISNFEQIFGPLYQYFAIGNFHFFLISSSLFCQDKSRLNDAERLKLKDEQAKFLNLKLLEIKEDEQIFLFLHDPDALEFIESSQFFLKHRNVKTFCGHLHAEESLKKYIRLGEIANEKTKIDRQIKKIFLLNEKGRKTMEWAAGNLRRVELFRKYNLQIIPAAGGMMGSGGGFLVLNLYDGGGYEIEKRKIKK